jgi:hypothetical protein
LQRRGGYNTPILASSRLTTEPACQRQPRDGGWVGAWAIGGFVGINIGGTISNSWSSGNIYTLNATDIGGFAGENYSAARSTSVLNNVSSSGTITIGWDAYQRYGTSAGGLVVANSGNINGGYTSSNIVVNALYYAPYGFSLLFQSVGAGFGDQMGNANAVTATGTVTYNGQLQNVYTGGWDFGGTTNQIYTPGVPGVPPQQIGTLNRQLGAVQLAKNAVQQPAAARAAFLAAQAALLAREQQGANAANVAWTATNAAAASAAGKAGSLDSVTAALDANFKSIETSVQADDRRIRRGVVTTAATTTAGGARRPSFRSTIRSIEINGRRINVPENNAPNQNPR